MSEFGDILTDNTDCFEPVPKGSLFYDNSKFKIGNEKYFLYMCEGMRGRGKTTYWLQEFVEHSLESGWKFVYLRRTDVELQLAIEKGLFNSCQAVHKEFWEKYPKSYVKAGNIYLEDKEGKVIHIGYALSLNNIKGVSIEDADTLLFDEYVAYKRSLYKGGESGLHEPELFLRLLETLFRRRKFWAVLLGNKDTPSNPYNECWKVPFGTTIYKDKSCGLWYEYDYSEVTALDKDKTPLGIISRNTNYADYSQGLKSLDEVDTALIADKPPHSRQLYNIRILGELLTVWQDIKNGVLYINSTCKYNSSVTVISVTNSDMTINTDFIRYSLGFLEVMRSYYGRGRIRFDNQKSATLFATMLSLK